MNLPYKKAIGILGGTFDPIHFGHLRTAVEIQQTFNLAEVKLIPCYQPVHRKPPLASAEQRFAMAKWAIAGETALSVDDYEIRQKVPSYSVNTLHALRAEFPQTPLCLIMGIDALLGFTSWYRYEEIMQLAHILVAHRPHYQLPHTGTVAQLIKKCLQHNPAVLQECLGGNILFHPVTALEISATDIRKQIALGQNPRYLLPDQVLTYIQEHGVYI